MIKVHIIGKKNGSFDRHVHPIRVFRKELLHAGIDAEYFSNPIESRIDQCNVLIFMEAGYRDILPIKSKDRSAAIDYLSSFFDRFDKVIWFDDHDSSGMLRTYVFPLVDIYAKSQILHDKTYYQQNHLTGVIHRDYVNEFYKIDDRKILKGTISEQEIKKIRVAWNLSMINWPYFLSDSVILKKLFYFNQHNYKIKYSSNNFFNREKLIKFRGNLWESDPTVNWWRTTTKTHIDQVNTINGFSQSELHLKVGKKQFHEEINNTMITPSPFGFGEICFRDFEAFIFGSLLFKPNMDHLNTWPNLYIDGVTYISHKWDFSDFNDKLEDILTHPERYDEVAREGQNRFKQALSDGAGFARHFAEMIA